MASSLEVINVLPEEYYTDCHITGSVNVPLDRLELFALSLPKDVEIVVYCAHYNCSLSRKAWHLLNTMGLKNIMAYEGGMREWYQKKYPKQGLCTNPSWHEPSTKPAIDDPVVKKISAEQLLQKLRDYKLVP
jgi:rhodanese-related sulfurtransferase